MPNDPKMSHIPSNKPPVRGGLRIRTIRGRERIAEVFGLSERQTSRALRDGSLPGVSFRDRAYVIDNPYVTPETWVVPAERTRYRLPKGADGVALEYVSGPVSGVVFFSQADRRREVEVWADRSGVIVRHVFSFPDGTTSTVYG